MNPYDIMTRGFDKTLENIKENIEYYIIEYFLEKEFKSSGFDNYNNILKKFKEEHYFDMNLGLFDYNTFETFDPTHDYENIIPKDLYKNDYTSYIREKYYYEIAKIITLLNKLERYNPEIYRSIEFEFLDEKYRENIDHDLYLTLTCFPKIQYSIIRMTDNMFECFINTINKMKEKFSLTDILTNFETITTVFWVRNEYVDPNNIDYDILIHMIFSGCGNIESMPMKGFNIYNFYKEETDEQINSNDRLKMITAILKLKYGLDLSEMQNIFEYADEIIKNKDTEISKLYEDILRITKMSEEELINVYNSIKHINLINGFLCKKEMKMQICQLYNNSLLCCDKGSNMYEAPDDFSMIVHVTGAFSVNDYTNYKESWNRNNPNSLWMSCSYISDVMLCTAPIREKSVCYGFNSMANDSLLYYSKSDLQSSTNAIEQTWMAALDFNILPKNLINETSIHQTTYYNELNFARLQNGEKKQPDYLILFKNNGNYVNEEYTKKAQQDFGDIPIIIIDVDKVLKRQEERFFDLLNKMKETKDTSLIEEMVYIASNCKKTCHNWGKKKHFFASLQCEEFINGCKKYIREKLDPLCDEVILSNSENIGSNKKKTG